MNSENSKTFDTHRLKLILKHKIDVGRILKSYTKTNLKYQEQHAMTSLNCLIELIPYQTFKIVLGTSSRSKKHSILTRNNKLLLLVVIVVKYHMKRSISPRLLSY